MELKRTSMTAPNVQRILIVDDQPLFRDGLKSHLSQQADLSICGEANGISQAVAIIRKVRPEVSDLGVEFC